MREELVRRPLVIAFLGLCAGLSSGFSAWNAAWALLLVPLLWRRWGLAVLAGAVALGLILKPEPRTPVIVKGAVYQGTVTVVDVPTTGRGRTTAIVSGRDRPYRLYLPPDSPANLGDVLALRALVVPLPKKAVRHHLEVAALAPEGRIVDVSRGSPVWRWAVGFRRSFLDHVERHVDPAAVGMVEALCMNVTDDIGSGTYEDLRRTGTIHVVSASGLHVTVLCVALAWLLMALPLPKWVQNVLLVSGLFLFAAAAGFHPPMLRSVLMVLVATSAYVVRREADAFSALALAGTADLLWRPADVADLGFQLSFLAVGALIAFGGPAPDTETPRLASRIGQWGCALARASLVATLASLPLLASTFGEVSVVGTVANLLVIPVLPLVVVGAIASWAVSWWSLPVSVGVLKLVVEPTTGWISATVESVARWPFASLPVPPVPTFWLVPLYAALACLYEPRRQAVPDSRGNVTPT
ncbi:MAG: ComEC/Rec2 family competence protein [Armatimonadetes bacterium]|nr:ComEC/Rec2 family competence protein [Armatimonadota bacterium]